MKRVVEPWSSLLPVELLVLPRSKVADHLLSKSRGHLYKSVISIGDPGARLPSGYRRPAHSSLRLEFVDSVDPLEASAPSTREVLAILNFAPIAARLGGRCLIHCEAGVSRSTAAAAIVSRALLGPGSDDTALALACRNVAAASPNRLMLALADTALHNEGRLLAARDRYLGQ